MKRRKQFLHNSNNTRGLRKESHRMGEKRTKKKENNGKWKLPHNFMCFSINDDNNGNGKSISSYALHTENSNYKQKAIDNKEGGKETRTNCWDTHIKTNKKQQSKIDNNRNVPKCKRSLYFLYTYAYVFVWLCNIKCANILCVGFLALFSSYSLDVCVCMFIIAWRVKYQQQCRMRL